MKKIFCALLLLCALGSHAQKRISGTVTNTTGKPLTSATVVDRATGHLVRTDARGRFKIEVDTLPVRLRAFRKGYGTAYLRLAVGDSIARFRLRALPTITYRILPDMEVSKAVVVADMNTYYAAPVASAANASASFSYSTSKLRTSAASAPPAMGLIGGRTAEKDRSAGFMRKELARKRIAATGGLLTAGELNDFKKWKLWSDYTPETFSSSRDQWGLVFRQRYCVQVQNETHRPVVDEPVYLLSSRGDTLWASRTDNTGKAELWGREDADQGTAGAMLSCGGKRSGALTFAQGINQVELRRACTVSDNVDIAFVIDATGSMGDEISYLQKELGSIITRVQVKQKDLRLRTASVFYRDKDDDYLTRVFPFTDKPATLTEFISKQGADGGGDFPEAVDAALDKALNGLKWSATARARILFLVLDAPPHDDAKARMKGLLRKAAAQGIRVVPVVCSGIDKPTEYLMRCLALGTNGTYVFLTDDSGIGDTHLKPTTDDFKVELLADLMVRLADQMTFVAPCAGAVPEPPVAPAERPITLTLYPNPARDHVSIQCNEVLKELFLTDFTGKVLQRINTSGKGPWRVELANYPAGTYLVRYLAEGKGWGTEKVVLAR